MPLAVAGGIDAADVKVTVEDHAVVLTGVVATAPEIDRATGGCARLSPGRILCAMIIQVA